MKRRGVTLLEVMVAGMLLAVMMGVCLQLLWATAAQHRAMENRQAAIRVAGNLMERLAVRPWEELTPQNVGQADLSEEARQTLPGGEVDISVSVAADDPQAKRIAVSIRWQDRAGNLVLPVQLVAWKYRPAGELGLAQLDSARDAP